MGLPIEEQEFCINANRDDDFATMYISDSTWITKLDKLVEKSPDLYSVLAESDWGKTYKFPKKMISLRSSIITRELSEEEKAERRERLAAARNNIKNKQI